MVTCQSSELGWEVTVEFPADFLSLGRGSVIGRGEERGGKDQTVGERKEWDF